MGNRELSRLSQRAIRSNGWIRKSLCSRLSKQEKQIMKHCNNLGSKKFWSLLVVISIISSVVLSGNCYGQDSASKPAQRNDLLEKGQFIQIPGPNPILTTGPDGAWDYYVIETGGVLKDFGTYYLYYHSSRKEPWSYQTGVATSTNPLGPFKKYKKNPIMTVGPKGSWDDVHVAHAIIIKEGLDKYYLWYCGSGVAAFREEKWSIGLATASSPLGPWKKYENNPIIEDFGYVGAVVKVDGKYYLYSQYPVSGTADDYGPIALAVADKPEGPYERYSGNPVMAKGQRGEWDDDGYSDVAVNYSAGVFHGFYGGVKAYHPRMLSRESIGYAYSFDGYNWIKYGLNPVATRYANPNAGSFSELRTIWEPPFIYVYHTLRYKEPITDTHKKNFPYVEDIGIQVLATQRPFRLDMPVLNLESLAPGETTPLLKSPPVCLSNIKGIAITAQCKYDKDAKKPIRLHVVSSTDGLVYDTTDLYTFENDFKAGETARKTVDLNTNVRFIKIIVENQDMSKSVSEVKITATLKG